MSYLVTLLLSQENEMGSVSLYTSLGGVPHADSANCFLLWAALMPKSGIYVK